MKRLVVTDAPGTPAVLVTAYDSDGGRIEVPMAPIRALKLARDLLDAAESRLRTQREAGEAVR
jgi:hypothetical protein